MVLIQDCAIIDEMIKSPVKGGRDYDRNAWRNRHLSLVLLYGRKGRKKSGALGNSRRTVLCCHTVDFYACRDSANDGAWLLQPFLNLGLLDRNLGDRGCADCGHGDPLDLPAQGPRGDHGIVLFTGLFHLSVDRTVSLFHQNEHDTLLLWVI